VRQRLVVLISGAGTNLLALLQRLPGTQIPADVVAVGSDTEAPGLHHASDLGIPTFVVPWGQFSSRDEWGVALGDALAAHEPDLIILSGFMKLLPPALVSRFSPRIINTHPAYLPEFPGAHAVRDALAAGATETGASVIVVDEGVDTGQILAQRRVPLEPGDDETVLHDRIKVVERELLLEVLENISTPTGK
jgi:phosphoribosylglycinamide formyltransferase 1